MKKASLKETAFGTLSGLVVFWLGIISLGALLNSQPFLPFWTMLVMAASLCILSGGFAGWFSRNWGWLFGGLVVTPFSLLCIILGMLLFSPLWVFTPLAALGMSGSFSPLQAGIGIASLGIVVLILGGAGGFLGEKLFWRFHK